MQKLVKGLSFIAIAAMLSFTSGPKNNLPKDYKGTPFADEVYKSVAQAIPVKCSARFTIWEVKELPTTMAIQSIMAVVHTTISLAIANREPNMWLISGSMKESICRTPKKNSISAIQIRLLQNVGSNLLAGPAMANGAIIQ
jgi:hypothetical protein